MKDIFSYLSGGKENSILHKLIRILLGSNLIIIFVLGIIAFYGLVSALHQAEEMGQSLGNTSYQDSSQLLVRQRGEELLYIARYNAKIIQLVIDGEGHGSINNSMEKLRDVIDDIHLSNSGFCFALNKQGKVVLSSQARAYEAGDALELAVDMKDDIRESDSASLARIAQEMCLGHSGVQLVFIDEKDYYVAYTPIENTGWSVATVFEKNQVIAPIEENRDNIYALTKDKLADMKGHIILISIFMVAVLLMLLFFVIYEGKKLSKRFVASILKLADSVREISKKAVIGSLSVSGELPEGDKKLFDGSFSNRVDIRTGDEIEELANCFNIMTDELEGYMDNLTAATAEKERISTELNLAQDIQNGVLPHKFPPFPEHTEFSLYASMESAKEVGGDFYDFYMVDEHRLAVTIADVSGKGVGAAMFMAISKTILKNLLLTGKNMTLADLVNHANNQLKEDNTARMFVTAFIGILDIRTGLFEFVNGGHNPSLIYEKEKGAFRYLDVESNFVLAGRKNISYVSQSTILKPGDSLFLYTDGVTEAMNNKDELYGEERLLSQLNCSKNADEPQSLLEEIGKSVAAFVGDAEQSDDITMLALTYFGPVGEK